MTFKAALEREKEKNPDVGMYIHLCYILQESGCKRPEILKIFNKYMPKDEFFPEERKELIDYLVKIASPYVP